MKAAVFFTFKNLHSEIAKKEPSQSTLKTSQSFKLLSSLLLLTISSSFQNDQFQTPTSNRKIIGTRNHSAREYLKRKLFDLLFLPFSYMCKKNTIESVLNRKSQMAKKNNNIRSVIERNFPHTSKRNHTWKFTNYQQLLQRLIIQIEISLSLKYRIR